MVTIGLNGVILQMIFHGLISVAFFFLAGTSMIGCVPFFFIKWEQGLFVCPRYLPCLVVSHSLTLLGTSGFVA